MEATVLLKVLEETDRCTLSFDMDDFNFLVHTSTTAFFWEKPLRFEVLRSSEGVKEYDEHLHLRVPQEDKEGWYMYWVGNGSGGSDTDALLAWKILLSQGYEGHLLWDCAADELRDGCHVILTDYVAWPTDQSS